MPPGLLETQRRDAIAKAQRAFADLVQERGYDSVTLADVAQRAGMARTSMYNYYRSKEALLVDAAVAELERLATELRGELLRTPDPLEQLRVLGHGIMVFFEHQDLPLGSALHRVVSSDTHDRIAVQVSTLDDLLRPVLERGAAAGVFSRSAVDDPRTVPLVMACFTRDPHDPATHEGGFDEVVEATLEFVLRALGARPRL